MLAEISPQDVTVLVAFGGGIVSIFSPCVLPMVPGYLSLVTGLSVSELSQGESKHLWRIAKMTGSFTLGFGAVFTLLGLAASGIGNALFESQATLTRISGVFVIVMAAYLAGSQLLIAPRLYPEARFQVSDKFGMFTAPVAGAAFGLGWSPCLGPVIAAVFGVAATQTTARAVMLLVAYSLGMGVSFLGVGLAFGHWAAPLDLIKRHLRSATLVSAAVLAVFGVLLVMDEMWLLTRPLVDLLDALGLDKIVELG